jgi:O-antigen/teichoic acid export membrane protein
VTEHPPAASAPADPPPERKTAVRSALWATGQQMVLMGSTAIFSIAVARSLTVAEFGAYSYATSLASLGMAVVSGGLGGLAIKAFIDDPDRQRHNMAALIGIREAFALLAYLGLVLISFTSGSSTVEEASAIALLVLFARAWDGIEYWYQSRLESQRTALVRITVVVFMLGVRLVAVFLGAPLEIFLVLYVVESVLIAIGFAVRFARHHDSPGLTLPRTEDAKALLSRSWILLLSGIAGQIDLRADQVIIQALMGSTAVGIYAAAAKLSELTYFLPLVFMTATFPLLLDARKRHGGDSREYKQMLQRSYDQACWIGIGIMAVIWLVGPTLITLLYGHKYDAAGAVLRIHVLALPFVFMAAVFSKWILAEDHLMASLIRRVAGAVLNIALNFILIPHMGIEGAALATVVSYTVGSYLVCFVGRSMRPAGIQMTLALVAPVRLVIRTLRAREAGT